MPNKTQTKKGAQKHQNTTKFKVNEKSSKSQHIQKVPLNLLCQRCFDQIKWKIDYKKYKALTTASRCVECKNRNIVKAYRCLCDTCAKKKVECQVGQSMLDLQKRLREKRIQAAMAKNKGNDAQDSENDENSSQEDENDHNEEEIDEESS